MRKLTMRERALFRLRGSSPTEDEIQKKMEELAAEDAARETRKGGRPPSKNPRTNHLNFKLSDAEVQQLEYAAEVFGVKKTKIIAMGIEKICAEAVAKERSERRKTDGGFNDE